MQIDQLRLIGARVLVRRDEAEKQTDGGLHIPDAAQTPAHKVLQGTVVKCGPGGRDKHAARLPMPVAPGDRVLYGFLDGHDQEMDGKQYVILEASEIRAVLN